MITPARTGREVSRRQIPFKGGALDTGGKESLKLKVFLPADPGFLPGQRGKVFRTVNGKVYTKLLSATIELIK